MQQAPPIDNELLEKSSREFRKSMEDFLGISVEYIRYLQKKTSTSSTTGGGGSGSRGPRSKNPTEATGGFPNFGLGPFPFIRKGRRGPLRRKLARRLNRSARNSNTSKATRQRYARRFGNQAARNRFQGNVRFNNRGAAPQTGQGFTKPTKPILPKGKVPSVKGVRGGPGPLAILFAGLEFGGRKLEGQSNLQAGVGTAASTAGGMAGFAAGAKGGALAGAAIGAMFGGVGAVPGAAIGGFIGGLLGGFGGSALAGGIADKATGVGSEPKFAEGTTVTAPTRALVGEAGPELVLPFGKIGAALAAVYREGGSLILGSTLALLNALPGNPAVAKIKSDVTSLGGVFGIGDVPSVKKISVDKLKKIPDADEFDITKQTVSADVTTLTDTTIADAAVVKSDFFTNENVQLNGNINEESTREGYEINDGEFVLTSTMGNRTFALSPGMHMGIDLAGPEGSPLYAFMSGKVLAKGWDGGYGNYVVWQSSDGIEHLYGHLVEPAPVEVGQEVSAGTVVGLMGNTGKSDGPHLHWETSTEVGHTGRPKNSVLSRFNPLSKYSLGAPVGREIPPAEPTEEDGKGGGRAGKTVSRLRGGFKKGIEPPVVSTTAKTVRETPVTQQKKVKVAKVPVVIPVPSPPQIIPVPVEVVKEVNTKRTLVIDVFGKGVVS